MAIPDEEVIIIRRSHTPTPVVIIEKKTGGNVSVESVAVSPVLTWLDRLKIALRLRSLLE